MPRDKARTIATAVMPGSHGAPKKPRKAGLTHLGRRIDHAVHARDIDRIEWSGGDITIALDATEFTSHCPVTGQPDFGRLTIEYKPTSHILETKGVKLYLWSFRDLAAFNEVIVDRMAEDLFERIRPAWLEVRGVFNLRGGVGVTAVARRESSFGAPRPQRVDPVTRAAGSVR